jgi:hypothetical protein
VFGGLEHSMNPAHAVDIYVDATTLEATIFRRRGALWWHSGGGADPYLLGLAVNEALRPGPPRELIWEPAFDHLAAVSDNRQIVVVWRQDHRTIVATPYCSWGKAPDIVLGEMPSHRELGQAVLDQIRFSAAASATWTTP